MLKKLLTSATQMAFDTRVLLAIFGVFLVVRSALTDDAVPLYVAVLVVAITNAADRVVKAVTKE